MSKQCQNILKVFLSNCQCGFRKVCSAQHYLVSMLEKWKSAADNNKLFGTLFTNLSKEFDCLVHDLLIDKINAYEFNMPASGFVHNYFKNRM